MREYRKIYMKTKKCKDYMKKYNQSQQGKMSAIRRRARRRNLSFIPIMNNPFPEEIKVEYHHINNTFVIPIPNRLHETIMGKQHRTKVNEYIENLGFNLGEFTT